MLELLNHAYKRALVFVSLLKTLSTNMSLVVIKEAHLRTAADGSSHRLDTTLQCLGLSQSYRHMHMYNGYLYY